MYELVQLNMVLLYIDYSDVIVFVYLDGNKLFQVGSETETT